MAAASWDHDEAAGCSWEHRSTSWTDDASASWANDASDDEGDGDDVMPTTAAAARFEQQVRSYEREKVACRLKVCCMLQLVRLPTHRAPRHAA